MENNNKLDYGKCPACNCKRRTTHAQFIQVYTCYGCGALYGTLSLGDSYGLVLPYFDKSQGQVEERYFDFLTLGSQGMRRRHGWYNPETLRLTQTG